MVLGATGPHVRSLEVLELQDPLRSKPFLGVGSQSWPGTAGND